MASPALAQQKPPVKPQPPSPTQPKPSPQKPKLPRQYLGFIAIGGGIQGAGSSLSDNFTFDTNAETGTTTAEYAANAAPLIDVAIGRRFWKTGGLAVGFSRAWYEGTVHVESEIPHPFFDDQPRVVSGDADGVARAEMQVHAQVFWMREHRKWRTRVLGGVTYFNVTQDVVTHVNAVETYPYDTAAFGGVTTERASGSGVGINAGVDVAWMQTRQFGWGAAVRFTRGTIDLNGTGGRNVSTDAGGAHASVGIRIAY